LRLVLLNPNAQVIVQNPDDRDILVAQNFVRPDHCHVILGSGVDLQQFPSSELPVTDTPVILMPTRLVRDKGISVFVEAAKILRAKNIHVRCVIAGGITEHNPMALSIQEMQDFCADGAVTWLGKVTDMQTLYAQAHMIVYPSHYGEGIPKVLLEAAASGRAIITTDHPGCREVVQHHDNGLLVPVRDAASVAAGIEELLSDPNRLKDMGHASRKRAEKLFDVRDIVAQTLAIYDL
jgi:glycosyltransferase involved in cell wall biosynthesis